MRGSAAITFIVALAVWMGGQAYAQVSSPFSLQVRAKTVLCGFHSNAYVPLVRLSDGSLVTAQGRLKTVRSTMKKAKGSAKKKLAREERALKTTISRGRRTCAAGPGQSGAVPIATPTPAPTPNTDFGCFVPGNNTKPGCFGIPEPLIGNIERGETFYQANCRGCHIPVKNNRSWQEVTAALGTVPQMRPFRPHDQTIADIIAYLNRFSY